MANTFTQTVDRAFPREHTSPAYQGYQLLHIVFTALPLIAGADKFLHLLANWQMYLSPLARRFSPLSDHNLMLLVGVVEMAAGLLVAVKPRWGAAVVASWLFLIIVNLVAAGAFLDIALRDFGLMLSACALWRLSSDYYR
jgi:hypothetical protein